MTYSHSEFSRPLLSQPPGIALPRVALREGDGIFAPRVMMTERAFRKQCMIVEEAEEEVSWLGLVTRYRETFRIDDVFLVRQICSPVTTEMSEEGLLELNLELRRLFPAEGAGVINRLRYWGHSHVRAPTMPSTVDRRQVRQFLGGGADWFLSGIANKLGHLNFMLDLASPPLQYDGLPYGVIYEDDSALRASVQAELAVKVESRRFSHLLPTLLSELNSLSGVKGYDGTLSFPKSSKSP